jgi:hypothetical protein
MPSGEGEDGGLPAIPADQDVDLDAGEGCGKALQAVVVISREMSVCGEGEDEATAHGALPLLDNSHMRYLS